MGGDTPLVEGKDYYWEGGLMIFSSSYHLRRGYRCDHGCRHCPYEKLPNRDRESQVDDDSQTAQ